jgi:hypothetical protein
MQILGRHLRLTGKAQFLSRRCNRGLDRLQPCSRRLHLSGEAGHAIGEEITLGGDLELDLVRFLEFTGKVRESAL